MGEVYAGLALSLALWLIVEWRVGRLVRAVRHHEHVLRLHLRSEEFARMVLDEGAWDQEKDGLLARAHARRGSQSSGEKGGHDHG